MLFDDKIYSKEVQLELLGVFTRFQEVSFLFVCFSEPEEKQIHYSERHLLKNTLVPVTNLP